MEYKALCGKFELRKRLLDIRRQEGQRALQVARDMKAGLQALCTRPQRYKLEKDLPVEQPAPALYFKSAQFQEPGFVTKGVFSLPLYEACIKKFRNANADGEPAEQLWIRVAKEDFLANLTFICRAEEHARVTVIQGATADCKWFYDIFQDWVLACRRTDTCPGGYARALTNSPKLQRGMKHTSWSHSKALSMGWGLYTSRPLPRKLR